MENKNYLNFEEISNYIKEILNKDFVKDPQTYQLLVSAVFEQKAFEDVKNKRLIRTSEGIFFSMKNDFLDINKDSGKFVHATEIDNLLKNKKNNISGVLSNEEKNILSKIKNLLDENLNGSSFINSFYNYYEEIDQTKKDILENLYSTNYFNLKKINTIVKLSQKNFNTYQLPVLEEHYSYSDYQLIENLIRTCSIEKEMDVKLINSHVEIDIKENSNFSKNQIKRFEYDEYIKFLKDIKELDSFKESIIGKFFSCSKKEEFVLKLFEQNYQDFKNSILPRLDIYSILKTKEELYKKHNIENYLEKIIEKFPLINQINETYKNSYINYDNVINDKEKILNFTEENVNKFKIYSDKRFLKNKFLENQIVEANLPDNIDYTITLRSETLIDFIYFFNFAYDKKSNIAYPNIMLLSNEEDIYLEAVTDMFDYFSKNKIILKLPETNFFQSKFDHIFDSIDNEIEKYNKKNKENEVVYFGRWTEELEEIFKQQKIKDYNIIKNAYISYFDNPTSENIEKIKLSLDKKNIKKHKNN